MKVEEYNLRPLWDGILVIFDAFRLLCEKNGLRYYMAYGSAIGTVRHKGFIPWDDDLDVWMPREDYEKYLVIARNGGLPDFLSVETWWSNPEYQCSFSYIRDCREDEKQRIEKACNMRLRNIYMDVFPLDGMPSSRIVFRFLVAKLVLLKYTMGYLRRNKVSGGVPLTWREWIGCFVSKALGLPTLEECKKTYEQWATKYAFLTSKVSMVTESVHRISFPTDAWGVPIMMEFEGRQVPMPHNYDLVLQTQYGDYMRLPPVEQRRPSHPVLG